MIGGQWLAGDPKTGQTHGKPMEALAAALIAYPGRYDECGKMPGRPAYLMGREIKRNHPKSSEIGA